MSFLTWLRQLWRPPVKGSSADGVDSELFVYVKILESIGPIDRGEKYEDPLEGKLRIANLGTVSGGGSQLGDKRADGTRPIEFCGLDVDTTNLAEALVLLRTELPLLGAPEGTELHYTRNEVRLQDELTNGKWVLERPRTFLHPGFDV